MYSPLPALSTSARGRGLTRQSRCPVRVCGQVEYMKTPRSKWPVGWKASGETQNHLGSGALALLMRATGQGAMNQNSRLSVLLPPPATLNCLMYQGKRRESKGRNEANYSSATRPPGERDNGPNNTSKCASGLLILLLNNKSGQRR